jgi:energy-coupling factor transporter transmembrane protein EcfT
MRIRNDDAVTKSGDRLAQAYKYCAYTVFTMSAIMILTTFLVILKLLFLGFLWRVFILCEMVACLILVPLALKMKWAAPADGGKVYDLSILSCVSCYICAKDEEGTNASNAANLAVSSAGAAGGPAWTNKV